MEHLLPYKPDEKFAQKIAKVAFKLILRLLAFIGKPFYLGILSVFLFTIYIYYGVKKIDRNHDLFLIKLSSSLKTSLKKPLIKTKLFFLQKTYNRKAHVSKNLLISISIITVLLTFSTTFFWTYIMEDLPSPKVLSTRASEVSTKIYDRNGVLLYKIYKDQNRTPVKLSELPKNVILSTLAIEDAEFYSHPGFSLRGMSRALIKNTLQGKLTGGSTITQQLVKNTLLSPEKTFSRKLRELVLAIEVEFYFSKDQILEMYLNEVSYGGTAYGIEEASKFYFGKNAQELTLAEAALLAGLPQSPTKFSPFGSNPKTAKERQKEVLDQMVKDLFISEAQKEDALKEELKYANNTIDIKAPHFVMYVRDLLEDKYGKGVVEKGGLEVVTTLDLKTQHMTEKVVAEEIPKLVNYHVGNGAALVANSQTGEILAMVGSKNYFDIPSEGNVNVLTSLQQPGSSIKIVNYAYALTHGYTASSIINDAPISYKIAGQTPYSPKNYDGKFRGKLTLRSAFAESRNVPAVKVLASYGVDKMIDQGRKMGITTWNDPSNYGLSITLGGADIKPLELAQVYSVVANYGTRVDFNPILKVTNYKGKVLEDKTDRHVEVVLDPRVAFIITDILKDNKARTPAFGANSLLNIPNHKEVAVKTGTSNALRDNFAIGYNQYYLTLAWVGNNDNSPMSRIASGVTGATPIFNKIMTNLLADRSNHPWEIPAGVEKKKICSSYKKADSEEIIVKSFEEWFLKENAPKSTCLLH
ncbi:hypothetical protein A2141_05510 [Candidatus Woesebacteria bacterium RBG_16_40_11]|nr:MAG: hypothetical protein A2141_05510 [Candidatus Woesebacteria bacterium RBG_16_40_11]